MNNKSTLSESAFIFDAKMPLRQAIPLGLQHVLAMFVGNLTPLLIITGACGIAGGDSPRGAEEVCPLVAAPSGAGRVELHPASH